LVCVESLAIKPFDNAIRM